MRFKLVILFAAAALLLPAQGPDFGAIEGKVIEVDAKTGKKLNDLPGVLVWATRTDRRSHETVTTFTTVDHFTKTEINFTFNSLETGDWIFFPAKDGFRPFSPAPIGPSTVAGRDTRLVSQYPIKMRVLPAPRRQATSQRESTNGMLVLAMYKVQDDAQNARVGPYQAQVQVVDERSRPVAGAFVEVLEFPPQGAVVHVAQGRTGPDGSYTSKPQNKDGRADYYVVSVGKYGYESRMVTGEWISPDTTLVELGRPLDVSESTGIETFEASRRKVFTGAIGRTMEALPLSGFRSYDELALLASGIAPPPETLGHAGPSYALGIGTAGSFAANGLRGRENSFELDGGDDNDELVGIRRQGFLVPTSQPIESIQEFQVVSALPDARFGRSLGGQVSVTTKPSVGGFHGSAYGFFTDRSLSARNFFDSVTTNLPAKYPVSTLTGAPVLLDGQALLVNNPSVAQAPFSRLQGGAVTGFNIKDTYVSLAWEREIQKGREEASFAVPTVEQRGMFNSGASGMFVAGRPSLPDTVPGDAVFSLFPFPNNPLGPYGRNTYTSQLPNEGNGMRSSIKIDHKVENLIVVGLSGSFTRDRSVLGSTDGAIDSALRPNVRNYGFGLSIAGGGQSQAHSFRISGNGTAASLEPYLPQALYPDAPLLLNVSQPPQTSGGAPARYVSAQSTTGAALLASLGFPSGVTDTTAVLGPVGQLAIAGFSPVGLATAGYPQHRSDITGQIAYNGTVAKRRSVYTFGAEWLPRKELVSSLASYKRPLVEFSGLQNTGANLPSLSTASGTANLANLSPTTLAAAGVPSGMLETLVDTRPGLGGPTGLVPLNSVRLNQGNFYFQNERQIGPSIRMTAGLRVELNSAQDWNALTFQQKFNRQQLLADAQEAENACGIRCSGLLSSVTQAFPANFLEFTPGNRLGLDPRLGMAWLPLPERKWSVRGGFGFYSGQLPFFAANDARQAFNSEVPLNFANFPIVSNQGSYLFNLGNPSVRRLSPGLNVIEAPYYNTLTENPFLLMTQGLFNVQSLGLQPTLTSLALSETANNLRNPYSMNYSVGTEGEIHGFTLSISYVGTRGVKLLRPDTPAGGVNRGSVRLDSASVAASGVPALQGQLLQPIPQSLVGGSFTVAPTLYESTANSLYNSVQLEIRRLYNHGFQFSSGLTLSHAHDDSSDATDLVGSLSLPQNSQNRSEWGPSNFDMPLRFVSSFVWDVAPRQRSALLSAWQVSGIARIQSGQPFTVNSTLDVNEDGNLTDRLNAAGAVFQQGGSNPTSILQIAPGSSISSLLAAPGQNGAVGRNSFRAPPSASLDLALTKAVDLTEGRRIVIRGEGFNVTNSPQFGIPQRLLEAPAFGNEVRTTAPGRIFQLAVKFIF